TWSLTVPERPGKLRLKVRTLTRSVGGACPIPTHGPQAGSRMRTPAFSKSSSTPEAVIMVRICLLPGETVAIVCGGTCAHRLTPRGPARRRVPPPPDRPRDGQVLVPGVHARAEADLVGRDPGDLLDRDNVV